MKAHKKLMYKRAGIFLIFLITVFIAGGINTYAAASWQPVGTAGFSEEAYFVSLAIDSSSGTPYVAYRDDGNSKKATVMKYNGSSWVVVGSPGFSDGEVAFVSLAIDSSSGTPYVTYQDVENSKKVTVMIYDSSSDSWELVGGTAGFSTGGAAFVSSAVDSNGTPYIAYHDDANSGKMTVMKYNNGSGSWEAVGSPGFSAGEGWYTSLAIDGDGTPYVAYGDGGNSYKMTVMKYNSGSGSWDPVGGKQGFTANQTWYASLAFDGSGIPYVAYMDFAYSYKATVMKYNSSSGSWEAVGTAGFSAGSFWDLSLRIDSSGTLYVSGEDNTNKATVMKYDGSSWGLVGSGAISTGDAGYTSLALDSSGTPYVAFDDGGNSYKVTVMKYSDATPPTVSDGSISTSGITDTGATLSWIKATDDTSAQDKLQYQIYSSGSNNIDTVANIEANGTARGVYAINADTKVITGLTSSTTYYFNVIVSDEAGNKSAYTMQSATTAVETPSGGGGGGSSTHAKTVSTVNVTIRTGEMTAVNITAPLDSSTGILTAAINAGDINSVLEKAKADDQGVKTVNIEIPETEGANSYVAELPSAVLAADPETKIIIKTEAATVSLPGSMLDGSETYGDRVSLSIGTADLSGMDKATRALIGDKPVIELKLTSGGKTLSWNNPDAPVTVSIPYKPTAEELADPESIVIWYIDGGGNAVSIPNGCYDPITGTVTFTTTHLSDYAVVYNKVSFNDVTATSWYNKAISFIAAREITAGTGNGNYSPSAKLTRGEFLVLMMRAYGVAPDENPADNFSDAGDTYYTDYLAAAKRLSISAGTGGNRFAPDKEITRQEMFTLLYNSLKVIGQLPENEKTSPGSSSITLSDFIDAGQISSWAKDAMTVMVETGTISGNAGKLAPAGTATRAQMAQALYNLMTK